MQMYNKCAEDVQIKINTVAWDINTKAKQDTHTKDLIQQQYKSEIVSLNNCIHTKVKTQF